MLRHMSDTVPPKPNLITVILLINPCDPLDSQYVVCLQTSERDTIIKEIFKTV